MILRNYKKDDSPIIATWLRTEEELYKWSADRFNKFPLEENDIEDNYAPQLLTGRFFPLTAVDEEENVIGHFIIRSPREDDDLGVFENNESAKHCYEAVGFKEYSIRDCELPIGKWKCIDMEMYIDKEQYINE